jgi:cell wall assembly regulator SMI1
MPSIHDFATWEPLLRVVRAANAADPDRRDAVLAGRIGGGSWSLPMPPRRPVPGRAIQVSDIQEEFDAVQRVRDVLAGSGVDEIGFATRLSPAGPATLHLLDHGPAVRPGIGPYPGVLLLVEGAEPEPCRRLPDPVPAAAPAPTADPALLERTLRERLPDAAGATGAEIAEAEARLGAALPDELRALYRVVQPPRWDPGWGEEEYAAWQRPSQVVGCELFRLDEVHVADAASRHPSWEFTATEAVVTPPDAAVQGLVGSPGWIVFGDNGGGDRLAVDLTPGPRGHVGQVIMISHEESVGAELVADSLTDLLLRRPTAWRPGPPDNRRPAVAHVNIGRLTSIEAAAHPGLEVLSLGVWEGEPFNLAPLVALPHLRTLTAYPGTLADPTQIRALAGLEYLQLAAPQWRVLLDAGAVPPGLAAASILVHGTPDPLPAVDLANEILARWNRPPITDTVVEGDLGPLG